jgi:hypothetical protein
MSRRLGTFILIAVLLAGSACGGAEESPAGGDAAVAAGASTGQGAEAGKPAGATLPDPCPLLATADIKTVTGVDGAAPQVAPTGNNMFGDGPVCDWKTPDTFAVFSIQMLPVDYYDNQLVRDGMEPLAGLGTEALLDRLGAIYVRTATHAFFAQSSRRAANGTVGPEVKRAQDARRAKATDPKKIKVIEDYRLIDEATYRLAKVLAGKL